MGFPLLGSGLGPDEVFFDGEDGDEEFGVALGGILVSRGDFSPLLYFVRLRLIPHANLKKSCELSSPELTRDCK